MKKIAAGILNVLSSSKLALALVLVLILFSLAGAVLPQEGMMDAHDIAAWQEAHPLVTTLMSPAGFFRVFHSVPFLATIFLLALNTLTCTLLRISKEGGFSAFKGPGGLRNTGFLVLHLSLIILFAGGFRSASASLDGYILLTEGQIFKEEHNNYMRLVEGPLRTEHHQGFFLRLNKVKLDYQKEKYIVGITSYIEIRENREKVLEDTVKVNYPLSYRGLDFTHDKTGFSPRLMIREKASGKTAVNSFIALKTFGQGQNMEYRDYLPVPFFKNRVIVTLYPAHTRIDGQVKKTGEEPLNPVLLVETVDETGKTVSQGEIPLNGWLDVEDYSIGFTGLRRWTSFRVVEDPGYPIVWVALWLGMIAFIIRYIPDFKKWFARTTDNSGSVGQ